jgi:hypothetical protein
LITKFDNELERNIEHTIAIMIENVRLAGFEDCSPFTVHTRKSHKINYSE